MHDAAESLHLLYQAVASSAVVSAAVALIAKFYFDRRLAILEETLKQQSGRMQTLYSTLQKEQPQTIRELYARVVEVESLLKYIAVKNVITGELAAMYADAVEALVRYYLPNRIMLPPRVYPLLDEMTGDFFAVQKEIDAVERDTPMGEDLKRNLLVARHSTTQTLDELTTIFQQFLGTGIAT